MLRSRLTVLAATLGLGIPGQGALLPAHVAEAAAGQGVAQASMVMVVPTPASSDGLQAATERGWGPVVAGDEFNYTGAPDRRKWSVYHSAGHAGRGVRSRAAWNVDGTMATVTGDTRGRTGGMSAKFDHRKYGRWETRMRVPFRDSKYHPVLILWPDKAKWPCGGEIDYSEATHDLELVKVFLHYSCRNRQTRTVRAVDSSQWHNYAVEWTRSGIVGYLDGAEWFRDDNTSHLPPGSMHQTMQLDWFPNGKATRESSLQVDWVRVYDLS